MELKIDPEFQSKIPPLTMEEYEQLKANILHDGEVSRPIVVWNGVIVDGHNRWKIIQENPWLPYKVNEMDFPNKWAAFDWMYSNQLGQRNCTVEQKAYMIGKMYEARKNSRGGDRRSNEFSKPQNGGLKTGATAESIAEELHIGENTVTRNASFAKGVDAIREVSPETANKILSGEVKPTRTEVASIAKAEPEERKHMVQQIVDGKKVTPVEVPDKVVHQPKAIYNGGGTAEYRAKRNEIAEVVAGMYDPASVPEYDLNELLKEIGWNADVYIKALRNSIRDHIELTVDYKCMARAERKLYRRLYQGHDKRFQKIQRAVCHERNAQSIRKKFACLLHPRSKGYERFSCSTV